MTFDNVAASIGEVQWALPFWPVLVVSFFCGLVGSWGCMKIALRLGIVDEPDDLVKTHKEPVAYLGGVGILVGLIIGVSVGIFLLAGEDYFQKAFKWLVGVLVGGTIVCVVGVVDDITDIKPWQKVAGQLLAGAALVVFGIRPELSGLAESLGWRISENVELALGVPIVIVFVLGATNSLNLLDGIDGLCGSVTVVMGVGMLVLAIFSGGGQASQVEQGVRVIISLSLIGAVCGFLPFNRQPAKIFMGDAGSMLLGFVIAAMMILFSDVSLKWWMASVVVFGLPILDTAVAFARRWINKRPFFVSDRGHIYDQMMDRGMSVKKTVCVCCCLAGIYVAAGVLGSWMSIGYAVIGYLLVVVISAVVVWRKGYLRMDGLRGAVREGQAEP